MSKKKEQTEGPEAPQTNNVFSKPAVGQAVRFTPSITLRNPLPYMDKVEKILEKYKTYIGVRYVKVVARPYKTRDAFTDLSSSPPTIYLNEHLIDDEEVVEYLIIRELIHIKLHRYPQPRYGVSTLTYTDKFYNTLYFLMPKEKVEEIRERIVKKLIEVNRRPR